MKRYPVLKENTRIKKMKNFCWVIEPSSRTDKSIAPIEAFILASLNGEWKEEELTYLTENIFNIKPDEAGEIVKGVMTRLSGCITYFSEPRPFPSRYNPSTFLYPVNAEEIAKQERLDTPSELHFSLTHACNFRCIYCFNASDERAENEMSTVQWLDIIRQIKKLDVLKCTLTGGEPTIYPGITQIIRELKRKDILICLCTNGSNFNKEMGELLKGSTVQISLDTSDPGIHCQLTGRDNLCEIMDNIKKYVACGANVQVKCVLTPHNLKTVADLYRMCNELGIQRLVLDRFDVSSCGRGDTGLLIREEEMEVVRNIIRKIYKEGMTEAVAAFHPHIWKEKEDIIPCAAFRRSLIILPDGEVSACEKILDIPEMRVGNARNNTLKDIWNSEKIRNILCAPHHEPDSECCRCEFIDSCNSGCYALKTYYGKPLFGKDPRCFINR